MSTQLQSIVPRAGVGAGSAVVFMLHGFNLPDLVWPFFLQHPR